MKEETIVAISTAMSNSGIGIIRISGSKAFDIIDKIYKPKLGKKVLSKQKSHTIHYGYIIDEETTIDEVIVLLMKSPNSYTKEDIVEIDCHGGITVMKRILELVIKKGARCAEPGEFTKRAFINGRIDLSQAEAVIDVINSKNEYALRSSVNQLKGNILDKIQNLRKIILNDIAYIEASLDDPEHINSNNFKVDLLEHINNIKKELCKLLDTFNNGKILKEGIKTVIVGKPNAGKSSLMNILVGEERAIVSEIEGTTRDTLEETVNLNGIILNIIDTAGIRETENIVEKIGIEKAVKFLEDADLILYVADRSTKIDKNDEAIIKMIKDKNVIILLNKSDIELITNKDEIEAKINKKVISISAKNNIGIDELEDELRDMFYRGKLDYNDEIIINNIRHKEAIEESINSLDIVIKSINMDMPEDFFSIDLMDAYKELGKIIGESIEEDLINCIFSEFCMGK